METPLHRPPQERIQWDFEPIAKYNKPTMKDRFKQWMQRWTGWYIGYKNHKLIRFQRSRGDGNPPSSPSAGADSMGF